MSTFDALEVGDTFETPARAITADDLETLVTVGGYTHPLFTDAEHARASVFGKRPLPGQAVLLLMGGLIEQTERFDKTVIGLLGFDAVRFEKPAFEGDVLTVVVEVVGKERGSTTGVLVMRWICRRREGIAVADATARMLFRLTA